MTNYLLDTFTGSGSLNTRTPDESVNGWCWTSDYVGSEFDPYPVTLSGGYATCANSTFVTNQARATYPASESLGILPADGFELQVTMVLTSISDVANVMSFYGELISDAYGVLTASLRVSQYHDDPEGGTAGPVLVKMGVAVYDDVGYQGGTEAVIPVVFGVEFTVVWTYDGASHTLSALGVTTSSNTPIPTSATTIDNISMSINCLTGLSELVLSPAATYGAQLAPPSPTLTASGSQVLEGIRCPSPKVTSTGHYSYGEKAAFLRPPSPLLTVRTGGNARTLRAPTAMFSGTSTLTSMAGASIRPAKPVLNATGTVTKLANVVLAAPNPNLVGYGGAVVSVTLNGCPGLTVVGTTGGVASAAATCPLFELTSTATVQNHGSVSLLAPSPNLGGQAQAWLAPPSTKLTAIGSAVVTATYEAYAVNLGHTPRPGVEPVDEVTRYTNFPFTHIVRYQNSYYGANSTGLYLLEGTTDASAPITFSVKTATTDFKAPEKKTVASAYFAGRFGAVSTISLHAGEQNPNTYNFTTPRDALAQNHRQAFGKGVKEKYHALSVSGTGVCEIDSIELDVHKSTRRI